MRLSEERTAQLLAEARDSIDQRVERIEREAPMESPRMAAPDLRAADLQQPDWRAAAFGGDDLDDGLDDGWSSDPLTPGPGPAPFPGLVSAPAEAFASARLTAAAPPPAPEPAFETPYETPPPRVHAEPFGSGAPYAGYGGADVADALEATTPMVEPSDFDGGHDEFAAETEFVDARSLRASMGAGAAAGRAASTLNTIDAARAAMTTPEEAPRATFGLNLKRGGKSRLQERLDKQASRDGSTVRKALLASVTSMAVIGGLYATGRLTGAEGFTVPGLDRLTRNLGFARPAEAGTATPLAAVALTAAATPTDAVPLASPEAQALYDRAVDQIDAGDSAGVEALTQAANLGLAAAQLKLAGLYETGDAGVTRDAVESRKWARRAAASGDPRGMHAFGMYLFDGVGGARNRPEALDWLLKAADRGLIDSQYNVARIYENGDEGIAPNPTEAFKWYLIAARTGDQPAQAAIDRLTPDTPAAGRRTARAAAEAFQVEPLA